MVFCTCFYYMHICWLSHNLSVRRSAGWNILPFLQSGFVYICMCSLNFFITFSSFFLYVIVYVQTATAESYMYVMFVCRPTNTENFLTGSFPGQSCGVHGKTGRATARGTCKV